VNRSNFDAEKREALVDAREVFHIARETIEGLDYDVVE
jgi:hypothetical protein